MTAALIFGHSFFQVVSALLHAFLKPNFRDQTDDDCLRG
jgi:hypothetical protein